MQPLIAGILAHLAACATSRTYWQYTASEWQVLMDAAHRQGVVLLEVLRDHGWHVLDQSQQGARHLAYVQPR
jgi:hypothetical protein